MRKFLKRSTALLLAAALCTPVSAYASHRGRHHENYSGCNNGSVYAEHKRQHSGWCKSGNRWWYCHTDGTYPKKCWKLIGGKYYYFDNNGYAVTGWMKSGNRWYYMKSDCSMVKGWQSIDGKWYHFDGSGAMQTGWKSIGGKWYYFNGSGAMAKNQWVGGRYYCKENGVMAADEWVDHGKYYVDKNGVWVPGKDHGTHTHDWVHEDAKGEYQDVLVGYDTHTWTVCKGCGARYYSTAEYKEHSKNATLAGDYGHGGSITDTVREPIYESKWVETQPARDYCSICGIEK